MSAKLVDLKSVMLTGLLMSGASHADAADKAFFELENAAIEARIRAAFTDADPFAAAKVVGLMFADTIDMTNGSRHSEVAREAILKGLADESVRFRKQMPDFEITDRDLFVSDHGVVMTGRMVGTHANGTKMDTAFVTIFTRDATGRIVKQSTVESPVKEAVKG